MKTFTNSEITLTLLDLLVDQIISAQISPICNGFIQKGNLTFPGLIPGTYIIYGNEQIEKVILEINGNESVTFQLDREYARCISDVINRNIKKTKEFVGLR